jgi:hypothetical protein
MTLTKAKTGESIKSTSESGSELPQANMNISIKCDHKDLKLKFDNHFIKGGHADREPDNTRYTNKIDVGYLSYTFRKKFKGLLIFKLQQREQEFPDDTFVMVGWEVPRFRPVQIYTVVVETRHRNVGWDTVHMRNQDKSFHNRIKPYTKPIEELWSLGNNTKIKLITKLEGDKDYRLKITICEDNTSNNNHPVRVEPTR